MGTAGLEGLLQRRIRERDEYLSASMAEIVALGKRVNRGEATVEEYRRRAAEVEAKTGSLNSEIEGIQTQLGISRSGKHISYLTLEDKGPPSIIPGLLALAFLAALLYAASYLYLHSMCVPVDISYRAPKMISLLQLVEDKSPTDYQMICAHVDRIGYLTSGSSMASGSELLMSDSHLDYYLDDRMTAGILVHEACHNMMHSIIGGFAGLEEKDVERPCERMRYLFLLKSGYYPDYPAMQEALAMERYGRDDLFYTSGIPSALLPFQKDKIYKYDAKAEPYCLKTRLTASESQGGKGRGVTITNAGNTTVHCGFIELISDGLEYPLGCGELEPGESYMTGADFALKPDAKYTVRVSGCKGSVEHL